MARNKNTIGPDDSDFWSDESSTYFGSDAWASAQASTDRSAQPESAAPASDSGNATAPLDATGTPAADVFLVHTGTLAAAVAQPPTVAHFSAYSAAQGDVVDFTAMRSVAFIPSDPTSAQLRMVADAGGQSATFQFNFGTAQNPNWTSLAKLDGVHAGDTVKVAIDATHTFELLV